MARKQQSKPAGAPPGVGLLNIAPGAAAQRGPGQSPVTTTTIRGKAADRLMAMQRQAAAKPGGKTTGRAAAALFSAMQQAVKQPAKKTGRR